MATIRNAVIIVLLQVWAIVAGVLASGVWHWMSVHEGVKLPVQTLLLYSYGSLGLVIPLLWGSGFAWLSAQTWVRDAIKDMMFELGVVILVGLIVASVYANGTPFLHIQTALSASDASSSSGE